MYPAKSATFYIDYKSHIDLVWLCESGSILITFDKHGSFCFHSNLCLALQMKATMGLKHPQNNTAPTWTNTEINFLNLLTDHMSI